MGVRSRCRGEPVLPDGGDSHAVTSPLSSTPQMTNSCGLQLGASLFIFSSPTCAAHVAARRSDLCPDLFPFLRGTGNSIALRAKTYIYARGWCRGSTLLCTGKKIKLKICCGTCSKQQVASWGCALCPAQPCPRCPLCRER